jgi:hypothetical protein
VALLANQPPRAATSRSTTSGLQAFRPSISPQPLRVVRRKGNRLRAVLRRERFVAECLERLAGDRADRVLVADDKRDIASALAPVG